VVAFKIKEGSWDWKVLFLLEFKIQFGEPEKEPILMWGRFETLLIKNPGICKVFFIIVLCYYSNNHNIESLTNSIFFFSKVPNPSKLKFALFRTFFHQHKNLQFI
jgi:hypothetical protein